MDTQYIAPYLLRSYVWKLLQENTNMKASDYDGMVPIVPLAEEPEIQAFDQPYIVYGFSETPTADVHARRRGNMAFVVYSTNFRELSKITNILTTALNRADESAKDVNEYTSTIDAFVGLRFGFIQVSYVEGGSPEETEGGRQSAVVNVSYEFYVDYPITTSFAKWDTATKKYIPKQP